MKYRRCKVIHVGGDWLNPQSSHLYAWIPSDEAVAGRNIRLQFQESVWDAVIVECDTLEIDGAMRAHLEKGAKVPPTEPEVTAHRLAKCLVPHEFSYDTDSQLAYCLKCGGAISIEFARWYRMGIDDGRRGYDPAVRSGTR